MARRGRKKKKGAGVVFLVFLMFLAFLYLASSVRKIVEENVETIALGIMALGALTIALIIWFSIIQRKREKLLDEILESLHLEEIENILKPYDDRIVVKSRQTLNNYTDIKYIKDNDAWYKVKTRSDLRKKVYRVLEAFLDENDFKEKSQYKYVEKKLNDYMKKLDGYRFKVVYITTTGSNKGERLLYMPSKRVDEIAAHPEMLMSKGELSKMKKQQAKEELDATKHLLYERVNEVIDYANLSKDRLIVKSRIKKIDGLVQSLFDRTVNSIQKVKTIDSDELTTINIFIDGISTQIHKIVDEDKKISDYYASDEFAKLKETCKLLTDSQREFNEYIEEKAQSITELFGTRVVRNETQHEDVYNYIRAYKKSITPFTAEVSSAVFGSAENNPIGYIIKYFYPNRSQYETQIEKLRVLIEELETLKEAKVIIDNYKKDYEQYIQDVPSYVLDNDENGFYSRLGLAVIDEAVLNVEYKFIYTSDGGFAQRSFTVPMNEENITELIHQLENKLSQKALAKEQRALMTTKLRIHIKERDNYTCCQCGNSVEKEPNLLLEIDHIIPISKGGLTQEDNLQTLCWKCNRSKGAKVY